MTGWAVTIYMQNQRPSVELSSINMRRHITKMYFPSLNFTFKRVFVLAKPQITVATVETSLANNEKTKLSQNHRKFWVGTRRKAEHHHLGEAPSCPTPYRRQTSVKQYCSLR